MTTNVSRLKMVKNFFDLKVWQDAHQFEIEIYKPNKSIDIIFSDAALIYLNPKKSQRP